MTREWVLQDNVTSAETIVAMMFAAMPESMKNIFFPEDITRPSRNASV